MNWLHRNKFVLLFAFLGIAVGFLIGKFISIPFFVVDEKVNLITLFQIAITLFLGIYVASKIQQNKSEKDLIIKRIESIMEYVEECHTAISDGEIEYSEAASRMKRTSTLILGIKAATSKLRIGGMETDFSEILENVKKIKDLTTDTPNNVQTVISKSNLPLEVQEGLIRITADRINVITIEYDKLKHKLLMLQLSVNQY